MTFPGFSLSQRLCWRQSARFLRSPTRTLMPIQSYYHQPRIPTTTCTPTTTTTTTMSTRTFHISTAQYVNDGTEDNVVDRDNAFRKPAASDVSTKIHRLEQDANKYLCHETFPIGSLDAQTGAEIVACIDNVHQEFWEALRSEKEANDKNTSPTTSMDNNNEHLRSNVLVAHRLAFQLLERLSLEHEYLRAKSSGKPRGETDVVRFSVPHIQLKNFVLLWEVLYLKNIHTGNDLLLSPMEVLDAIRYIEMPEDADSAIAIYSAILDVAEIGAPEWVESMKLDIEELLDEIRQKAVKTSPDAFHTVIDAYYKSQQPTDPNAAERAKALYDEMMEKCSGGDSDADTFSAGLSLLMPSTQMNGIEAELELLKSLTGVLEQHRDFRSRLTWARFFDKESTAEYNGRFDHLESQLIGLIENVFATIASFEDTTTKRDKLANIHASSMTIIEDLRTLAANVEESMGITADVNIEQFESDVSSEKTTSREQQDPSKYLCRETFPIGSLDAQTGAEIAACFEEFVKESFVDDEDSNEFVDTDAVTSFVLGADDGISTDEISRGAIRHADLRLAFQLLERLSLENRYLRYRSSGKPLDFSVSLTSLQVLVAGWLSISMQAEKALLFSPTEVIEIIKFIEVAEDADSVLAIYRYILGFAAAESPERAESMLREIWQFHDEWGQKAVKPNADLYHSVILAYFNLRSPDPNAAKRAKALYDEMMEKSRAGDIDMQPRVDTFLMTVSLFMFGPDMSEIPDEWEMQSITREALALTREFRSMPGWSARYDVDTTAEYNEILDGWETCLTEYIPVFMSKLGPPDLRPFQLSDIWTTASIHLKGCLAEIERLPKSSSSAPYAEGGTDVNIDDDDIAHSEIDNSEQLEDAEVYLFRETFPIGSLDELSRLAIMRNLMNILVGWQLDGAFDEEERIERHKSLNLAFQFLERLSLENQYFLESGTPRDETMEDILPLHMLYAIAWVSEMEHPETDWAMLASPQEVFDVIKYFETPQDALEELLICYNSLLTFASTESPELAESMLREMLQIHDEMGENAVKPNGDSYGVVIKAYCELQSMDPDAFTRAKALYYEMMEKSRAEDSGMRPSPTACLAICKTSMLETVLTTSGEREEDDLERLAIMKEALAIIKDFRSVPEWCASEHSEYATDVLNESFDFVEEKVEMHISLLEPGSETDDLAEMPLLALEAGSETDDMLKNH